MTTIQRLVSLTAVSVGLGLWAAPQTYDFKDPKGVNNVQFHLDAPLESIAGQGTGITGTVTFDPAAPEVAMGKIVLQTASLTVGNPTMREHLQGPNWLEVAKYPEIVFEAKQVKNAAAQGATIKAEVSGVLAIKGVSKELTVPVTFTHLPDKLGARLNKPDLKGDLLVLRATFAISRSDFGLQAGQYNDKVSDRIELTLSLAGAAAR